MTEQEMLVGMKKGEDRAFRALFDAYYKYLTVTSFKILGDFEKAKDLAQDVFADLWQKREQIEISSTVKGYLRRMVVNKTLNYIKTKRIDFTDPTELPESTTQYQNAQQKIEGDDLQQIINKAIDSLPGRCKIIFVLRRMEDMSHKEIGTKLDISPKTVENQMTKALKVLRLAVEPYMTQSMLLLLMAGLSLDKILG